MKFILDIDGVMVHANPHRQVELDIDGFYKFNTIAVSILNSVVNTQRGDELILSTSHRFRFSVTQWKDIFKHRGIAIESISIIETPILYGNSRKSEIVNWITTHHLRYDEVVIIDDDKSLNDLPQLLKERLVLTNSYLGLVGSIDLERLVKKKKKQLSGKKKLTP
jgi:hypothetical protein